LGKIDTVLGKHWDEKGIAAEALRLNLILTDCYAAMLAVVNKNSCNERYIKATDIGFAYKSWMERRISKNDDYRNLIKKTSRNQ
jgi:hypothetical protein